MKKEVLVIGDVHGEYKKLKKLLSKIDEKNTIICFVGDLIDRGENSKKIVDLIIENGYDCVLGNHELKAIEYLEKENDKMWLQMGGDKCLKSYEKIEDFKRHVNYFKQLPFYKIYHNIKDEFGRKLLISHTCCLDYIDYIKNQPLSIQNIQTIKEKFLWSREITSNGSMHYFNIFGHTRTEKYIKKIKELDIQYDKNEFKKTNVIISQELSITNVDTGACYDKNNELSAILYPSMKVITSK